MNFIGNQKSVKNNKVRNRLKHYWHIIKKVFRSHLEYIPDADTIGAKFWQAMKVVYRSLVFYRLKLKAMRTSQGITLPEKELHIPLHVSPKDIVYSSYGKFIDVIGRGLVIGGNWDSLEMRFEDLPTYRIFNEVISEKKNWQETDAYQEILTRIGRGEFLWSSSNKAELDKRLAMHDELIDSIRTNGYKSQKELCTSMNNDEVIVNIGRDGDFIFANGGHRLSIAKILEIEKIPIIVSVRHIEWMRFRKQLVELAASRGGKTYQPTLHPDLQFIPSHHECVDRFEMIKSNLPVKKGRLLDLGANLGYFCSRFEEEGFDCVAVENYPELSYCLKKLKRATNKRFEIVEESILDSKQILENPYDVVLALNIFHHFLKSEERFTAFIHFLENLQCKEIYFEPHKYNEPQMHDSYKNFQPEEFAEFVKQKTGHTKSELIGQLADGRQLFKIT